MATITVPEALVAPAGLNRWDSPWLNTKFVSGLVMVVAVLMMGLIGTRFWPEKLALVARRACQVLNTQAPSVAVTVVAGDSQSSPDNA